MTELIDYSWSRPSVDAIKTSGKSGVIRYLFDDGQGGKGLDYDEVEELSAAGLSLTLCYEGYGDAAHIDALHGATDGQAAAAQLRILQLPPTAVVYFCVDYAPSQDQLADVRAYLAAAKVACPGAGIYGSFSVCEAVRDLTSYRWQTYAWSGSAVSQGIRMYQYSNGQSIGGGQVDFDRTTLDDYGQVFGMGAVAQPPLTAPSTALSLESMATLAQNGNYGNGDSRKDALGVYYDAVQTIVNQRIGVIDAADAVANLAAEVWSGHLGDGDQRAQLLGTYYAPVQAAVTAQSTQTTQTTYTVQAGDSLSAIAAAHGLTLDQIEAKNSSITDPDIIHPGDVINI